MEPNNKVGNQKKNFFLYLILLILIFFLIVIFGLLISFNKKNNLKSEKTNKATISPSSKIEDQSKDLLKKKEGGFKIYIDENKNRYQLNEEITLKIVGDNFNKPVTAYDILLGLDKEIFQLISVNDLTNIFSIIKFSTKDHLTITAVKKQSVTSSVVFVNKEILLIKLKPLKKGRFSIKILSSIDKEKTQLVDENSLVYYPEANEVSVEIY